MTWAWQNPYPIPHDHPPHPVRHLADGIAAICRALMQRAAPFVPLLPVLLLALRRLSRAHARVQAILAKVENGTWRDPRPRRAATPGPQHPAQPLPAPPPRRPRAPYVPRRRGWLGHVTDHHVRGHALQLAHLLSTPGTQAILARAPAHARAAIARALRGPARLLDLALPGCLQFAGPPRPPSVRPPKPPKPELAPLRPIPRRVLAFARFNRRTYGPCG